MLILQYLHCSSNAFGMTEITAIVPGMLLGGLITGTLLLLWAMKKNRDNDVAYQVLQEKHAQMDLQWSRSKDELYAERQKVQELHQALAATEADYRNLQEKLEEQKVMRTEQEEASRTAFRHMASDIFEEQRRLFTEQNKSNLSDILQPLGEKIYRFEQQVAQHNRESLAWNMALKEQVHGLQTVNQKMSRETESLIKALKGDNKVQGDWGEFILEGILEKSGLRKDHEYVSQVNLQDNEGKRFRPDILVRLPAAKSVIIDAKTNLVAYERYSRCEDLNEQKTHLQAHTNAIRKHIRQLGQKKYHDLYGIPEAQLDFVLMFIPLEPAFALALRHDPELFNDAYQSNIVIVSPSTLLATLRTIANIWKNEYQNRNAVEIARQGGDLYDKFVAFTDDLLKIGKSLQGAQDHYGAALKKLSDGKGNLIQRSLRIKDMGIKTSKTFSPKLITKNKLGH